MMAPRHHGATRHVNPTRVEPGPRTIFHLLGPISNPAGVKRQLVGVYAPQWVKPLAEVLGKLGAEHLGERLDPLRRIDADELALDARRVRDRPEQVEDGAGAELDPRGVDMARGAMMARRHHEADAGLEDGAADRLGLDLDVDAERLENI